MSSRCRAPPNTTGAVAIRCLASSPSPAGPSSPIPIRVSQRLAGAEGVSAMGKTRILILGGTTEARQLAAALAPRDDLHVNLSLAGRTADPSPQPVPVRTGGFGGAEG